MARKKEEQPEGKKEVKKQAGDKKLSLEESFGLLNEYVQKMEQEELSLEESFSIYTKGMALVKNCSEMIDGIEKEIEILKSVEN